MEYPSEKVKFFVAHSLDLLDETLQIESDLSVLNSTEFYIPGRDTPQDTTEEEILQANQAAISNCDYVLVVWNGISQGTIFDLGVAYALGKPITVEILKPVEILKQTPWYKFIKRLQKEGASL